MDKKRLEAFSDGVFAIVITLLVLDIKIHETEYTTLLNSLRELIPNILSYITSFFVIGLYWLVHHFYIDKMEKIDGTFLFYNLLLLLSISILPFPTGLLGEFPTKTITLILYGVNILSSNLTLLLMVSYLWKNPHLIEEKYRPEFSKKSFRKHQISLFLSFDIVCTLSIFASFKFYKVSYALYILITLIGYIYFIRRMNKQLKENKINSIR
ncbi:MAG: TMEM175 family protein [Segetibacter sp.]